MEISSTKHLCCRRPSHSSLLLGLLQHSRHSPVNVEMDASPDLGTETKLVALLVTLLIALFHFFTTLSLSVLVRHPRARATAHHEHEKERSTRQPPPCRTPWPVRGSRPTSAPRFGSECPRGVPPCVQLARVGDLIWACRQVDPTGRRRRLQVPSGWTRERLHRPVSNALSGDTSPLFSVADSILFVFSCLVPSSFRCPTQEGLSDHRSARTARGLLPLRAASGESPRFCFFDREHALISSPPVARK
jgi:hypothetical protein